MNKKFNLPEGYKLIPEYEDYAINYSGEIIRAVSSYQNQIPAGTKIKHSITSKGRHRVQLSKDKQHKKFFVHRLVMLTFVGVSDLEVNHIDGNPSNNSLDNLEYCTKIENMRHAHFHMLYPVGEMHHNSITTTENVRRIRELYADGVNCTELGKQFGMHRDNVRYIVKRKTWKHVT